MGTSNGCARRRARGFSIIEAMLAFVVVTVAALGLVATGAATTSAGGYGGTGTVPQAFSALEANADQIQAYAVAQQYMDALHECIRVAGKLTGCSGATAPTASVDAGNSFFTSQSRGTSGAFSFPSTDPHTGSATNTCTGSSPLFTCYVTVTWNEQGSTREVSISSYAADQHSQ
jgi:Tfp pilus assembly protein PilV